MSLIMIKQNFIID